MRKGHRLAILTVLLAIPCSVWAIFELWKYAQGGTMFLAFLMQLLWLCGLGIMGFCVWATFIRKPLVDTRGIQSLEAQIVTLKDDLATQANNAAIALSTELNRSESLRVERDAIKSELSMNARGLFVMREELGIAQEKLGSKLARLQYSDFVRKRNSAGCAF
jgi:hypothetical protein